VQPPPEPDLPDPDLQRALAALRREDRELLRLWAWEDLTPGEIAAVLGVTANAVSIRLHRAKARLAARLAEGAERKDGGPDGQETVGERRTR
jgi:RNA polymerase sigma-70 factor (ECF subfamily)